MVSIQFEVFWFCFVLNIVLVFVPIHRHIRLGHLMFICSWSIQCMCVCVFVRQTVSVVVDATASVSVVVDMAIALLSFIFWYSYLVVHKSMHQHWILPILASFSTTKQWWKLGNRKFQIQSHTDKDRETGWPTDRPMEMQKCYKSVLCIWSAFILAGIWSQIIVFICGVQVILSMFL